MRPSHGATTSMASALCGNVTITAITRTVDPQFQSQHVGIDEAEAGGGKMRVVEGRSQAGGQGLHLARLPQGHHRVPSQQRFHGLPKLCPELDLTGN